MADETIREQSKFPTFSAGWRPLIGWIIAAGFFVQFVGIPIAEGVAAYFGHPFTIPSLDVAPLVSLTTGVLGLGGMRTVEKVLGVQDKH